MSFTSEAFVRTRRAIVAFSLVLSRVSMSQECPAEHPIAASLGFSSYVCYGGDCRIAVREGGILYHDFTVEPRVRGVDPSGPAAGTLRENDVLVAIDGALVTTRAGGERLANLSTARDVTLRIRRDGVDLEVRVRPKAGCNQPGISVSANETAERDAQSRVRALLARAERGAEAEAPVSFGLVLECGDCGWRRRGGGSAYFLSNVPPVVVRVDSDGPASRAGLMPGDTLVSVAGAPFVGGDRSQAWSALRPGRPVVLSIRRGRAVDLRITPDGRPRNF